MNTVPDDVPGDERSRLNVGQLDELPAKVALLDGDGTIRYTNDAWRQYAVENGFSESPGMVGQNYLEAIETGKDQTARLAAKGISGVLAGERSTFSLDYPCETPDGERHFAMKAIRREIGGEPHVLVIHVDVTGDDPRPDSTRQWATLKDAIDPLLTAPSEEFIAEVTVEAIAHALDVAIGAVYRFDESSGQLVRAASFSLLDTTGPLPMVVGENTTIWRAFAEQRTIHVRDGMTDEGADSLSPLVNQLVVPIDGRGVLAMGLLQPDEFGERAVEFATVLAGIVELALESFEQRQTVTAYDRQFERHDDRFEEISLLYTLLREITRTAERGSTRREIQREICAAVVDVEPFSYAWMGDHPDPETPFEVWEWASADSRVATRPVIDGQTCDTHPACEALETGDVVVRDDLTDLDRVTWVADALLNGYRSVVAIPLRYRGTNYGVLTIFSTDIDAFSREIEAVLSDVIGPTIAQTMSAIDRKDGLLSKRTTEIDLRIEDNKPLPVRIAAELDCELTLQELVPDRVTPAIASVTVDGASPEAVADVANQHGSIQTASVQEDGAVELTHDHCIGNLLAEHGCRITACTADSEGLRLSVAVPKTVAPKRVVKSIEDRYAGVDVRSITEAETEKIETRSVLEESLTNRQKEVLEAAYREGYVAWPRDATGEEIAERLGITQPTFNQHLWSALENLLDTLLDVEA